MSRKKKRPAPKLPGEFGIAPVLEKKGHVVRIEETMSAGQRRARVVTVRPIDRYRERGQISDEQWSAGDRFGGDWYDGCRGSRLTGLYQVRISGMPSQTEGAMAARERVLHIIRGMSRRLYPVLIHVCGLELSAGSWAALAGEPERSGLTVLRLALDDLLDLYRSPGSNAMPRP